jgi:DNA-binding protein
MNYVLACLPLFQNGINEVHIKARGKAISTAVDVAEITRKRFATEAKLKEIKIDTEQLKNAETNTMSNVSSIEIILAM